MKRAFAGMGLLFAMAACSSDKTSHEAPPKGPSINFGSGSDHRLRSPSRQGSDLAAGSVWVVSPAVSESAGLEFKSRNRLRI